MNETAQNSARFRKMADRIDHNSDSKFGGAAVVVPPRDGGDAVEFLILYAQAGPAQFWGTILSRAQLEISRIEDKNRIQQGFGMR